VPAKPSGKPEEIGLYDYTDKSFIVVGNTMSFKDELKALGGRWISGRNGSKCWNFSKRRLPEVAKLLGVPETLSPLD
jgi:hypothetical protein